MATPTVTLKNASDVDIVLTESYSAGSRKVYKDLTRAFNEPRTLTISSEPRGKGNSAKVASVARLDLTTVSTDGLVSVTNPVTLRVDAPSVVQTFAQIDENVRALCKKFSEDSAARAALIRGSFLA